MSSTLEELALRRMQLVARCDQQRVELSRFYRQLNVPVRATGALFGLAGSLRRSPWFILAMAAVLARTPWRKLARVPMLAWRGWRVLTMVRSFVR